MPGAGAGGGSAAGAAGPGRGRAARHHRQSYGEYTFLLTGGEVSVPDCCAEGPGFDPRLS